MENKSGLIKLTIVTPEESVVHSDVISVVLPGKNGYFEVLSGHTPFLTQIVPGIAIIKDGSGERELFLAEGYASVHEDVVEVIVDASEWPDEIDEERAKRLREEALSKLAALDQFNPEYSRWENRLKKAESRLELLNKVRNK
jgi:F-type H+-transporting ATPase subunit epsilon